MGVFTKNGWYWIDYRDAEGRRHRQKASLEHQIAKRMLRDKLGSIARGEITGIREEGMLLKDFIEKRYWPTVKESLSKFELKRARCIIDLHITPQLGGLRLCKIRQEDIEGFQAERLASTIVPKRSRSEKSKDEMLEAPKRVSNGTVKKEMMRLKHILNRAVAWRYIKDSPAKGISKVTPPPGRIRYLLPEERNALLETARPELRLYILAALQTGARRGELADLRWSDIDMKARTIAFAKTKNGERRVVPLTDNLRETLQGLPRPLDPQARVLPGLSADAVTIGFHRLTNDLGIADLRFHDLRHDVASTLTMAGVSQRAVMEILGHKDPRMTLRYQHLSPGHLHKAMAFLNQEDSGQEMVALLADAR
ncbi:MAG: site-specific integrase [Nitrospira sp.]